MGLDDPIPLWIAVLVRVVLLIFGDGAHRYVFNLGSA